MFALVGDVCLKGGGVGRGREEQVEMSREKDVIK